MNKNRKKTRNTFIFRGASPLPPSPFPVDRESEGFIDVGAMNRVDNHLYYIDKTGLRVPRDNRRIESLFFTPHRYIAIPLGVGISPAAIDSNIAYQKYTGPNGLLKPLYHVFFFFMRMVHTAGGAHLLTNNEKDFFFLRDGGLF